MANQVYQSNMQPYGQQNQDSFWRNFLWGSPEGVRKESTITPEQQQYMSQALQQGMAGMNNFDFTPIEQQARTGFAQTTMPSIAERFTALGGGQRSSAFNNSMAQAGAGLEQNLAAMKQQYNMQRMPMMLEMMNMGLRPQYENMMMQGQPGFIQSGVSSLLGGLGQGLGGAATLGVGNLMGAFGNMASQASNFSNNWLPQQSRQGTMFGRGGYNPQFGITRGAQWQ